MTTHQFLKFRIYATLAISTILGVLLVYQYFNGGIPSHYFLARKDMPLISNAWGMVTIPVITWFLLWRVDRRLFKISPSIAFPKHAVVGFVLSLVFGVMLGLSIQWGIKSISSNTLWILLSLALLFPIYRAECFLGFILGLAYFVGGVLPIVVGSIFILISVIIHLYIRGSLLSAWNRLKKNF